jgi:hypothetical protein
MKRVYKYPIQGKIGIPKGAEVLTARYQHSTFGNGPMLWALVDANAEEETRQFLVIGTGEAVPADSKYIATIEDAETGLVFHVFETPI